ncbi:hypothetical protein B0O99DRAFT_589456 [Bisporella sp. PMI_857]|nr:hypothetical protein B0O99DRAFT_589456 [Bisporella sp. PMI_857]
MCITNRRTSALCGHIFENTEICHAKKMQGKSSLFNKILPECKPQNSYKLYHEICHDCSRFFEARGVPERKAAVQYMEYRERHRYTGPLSPHSYHPNKPPALMKDGMLEASLRAKTDGKKSHHDRECACFLCTSKKSVRNQGSVGSKQQCKDNNQNSGDTVWSSVGNPVQNRPRSGVSHPGLTQENSELIQIHLDPSLHEKQRMASASTIRQGHFQAKQLAPRPESRMNLIGATDLNKRLPSQPREIVDEDNPDKGLPIDMFYPRVI